MKVAVPTEVKNHEHRVAIAPAGVHRLATTGHEVVVQAGAGLSSAFTDEEYARAGARVVADVEEVWGDADLVCKVKEPVASEYRFLRKDMALFTFLHLAADRPCTDALLESGTTSIAYETVTMRDGSLPLLAPMSEVAGRLSVQVGAYHAMRSQGGAGILLGGVPGVRPARVLVVGGGVVGQHAIEIALGMRARVTVMDLSLGRLRQLDSMFGGAVRTMASNAYQLEQELLTSDLVIGAVLVPGARTPRLVSNEAVAAMKPGSVLVDVAVDQGGCFVDTRPTTHDDPTYQVHNSVFYCVANMPGAVPVTSTRALTNATLPYLAALADHGWADACRKDAGLAQGLHTHAGALTNVGVAEAHGLEHTPTATVLA